MDFFINIIGKIHQKLVKPRQSHCIVDHLVRFLPSSGYVLDVGCGTGRIARMVEEINPNLQLKGIDILVQSNAEIEVQQFDGSIIPFPDNSFDAVTLVDVLHHTKNHKQLLSEVLRVSKGSVVIKDHLSNSLIDYKILSFMDWVGNRSLGILSIYNYFSSEQWDSLFTQVGVHNVKKVQAKKIYPFPFNLIFTRNMQVFFVLDHKGEN